MKMSERDLQKAVVGEFQRLQWRVLIVRKVPVRRGLRTYYETPFAADGAGWPDVFAVHEKLGVAIAAELKVGANKPEPAQKAWREALSSVPGILHYVWWAEDWHSGAISRLIMGARP